MRKGCADACRSAFPSGRKGTFFVAPGAGRGGSFSESSGLHAIIPLFTRSQIPRAARSDAGRTETGPARRPEDRAGAFDFQAADSKPGSIPRQGRCRRRSVENPAAEARKLPYRKFLPKNFFPIISPPLSYSKPSSHFVAARRKPLRRPQGAEGRPRALLKKEAPFSACCHKNISQGTGQ